MRDVCNSIKKGVATLGTLVSMILSAGVKAEAPVCYIPPDYSPNIVEVDKPEVNLDLSRRTVVDDLPEGAMFQSLMELAADAEAEEAFVYDPETERLLENGICELAGGVAPDFENAKRVARGTDEIYMIHIHPTRPYQSRDMGNENYLQAIGMLNDAISSYADIKSMIFFLKDTKNARHYAVSEYGVLEYDLTAKGRRYFELEEDDSINNYAEEYHKDVLRVFEDLLACTKEFSGCTDYRPADIVKDAAESLSDDYLKIRFRPARNF